MPIAVTGSIATDHLMQFPGKFADSLVSEHLDRLALSFLVDDLEIRRGGCAANIAFGLGVLGQRPLLVGAAGEDFTEYRSWLERHGVDCGAVRLSETLHTARFVCTTDSTMAQIASFYAGAMSEAREIELKPVADRVGGLDIVIISPNDPEAMLRHTEECRSRGYAFAADPSQQLAWSDGPFIRQLIEGAAYLLTNDYEAAMIEQKTGWDGAEIESRVGVRVVTHGADGVQIYRAGRETIEVAAIEGIRAVEPTGVGDSFRAGFFAAIAVGLDLEAAAQVGCGLAANVVETTGTQEYALSRAVFGERFERTYGPDAAARVLPLLSFPRP